MARGYPDWGAMAAKETLYGLADLGEVVARLGGIQTYDRAGDLVWFESFEDGYPNWDAQTSGTSGAVELSADRYRSRGYSVKLTPGATAAGYARINKEITILPPSRLGVEASFVLNSNQDSQELYCAWYSGSQAIEFGLVVEIATGKLAYYGSDALWHSVAQGLNIRTYSKLFHTAKVVLDVATQKYVRLLFDHLSYDLSAYSPAVAALTAASRLSIALINRGNANGNWANYVDDIIITQNEP